MIWWQLKIYIKNNDMMTIKNIYKNNDMMTIKNIYIKQWYDDN